jgi:hypothetical protein
MDHEKVQKAEEIEAKIAELKQRFPKHSVPPAMVQELEELEEELALIQQPDAEESDAR